MTHTIEIPDRPHTLLALESAIYQTIHDAFTPNKDEYNAAHLVLNACVLPDPNDMQALADLARIGDELRKITETRG
jgi:hypothetical protein